MSDLPVLHVLGTPLLGSVATVVLCAVNNNTRMVGLKNEDMEGILRHAAILRSCHGRNTDEKVRWRHQQNPEMKSVQGMWRPGLFEKIHVQPGP